MKILISHLSSSQPLSHSHPLPWKNLNSSYRFVSFPPQSRSRFQVSAPNCLSASSPATSATYNGWDDLRLRPDTDAAAESNQLRSYLISLGLDDRKYVIVYVFGFVCALCISRVRIPSIVVPAAAVIFAIGFSFGLVNGGSRAWLGSTGSKRKGSKKDELYKVYSEKLKNLGNLLNQFDDRVVKLRDDIRKAVDFQSVEIDDLEGYAEAVESMGLFVSNVKKVVDNCVHGISIENLEDEVLEKNSNQKYGRKKKESVGAGGFDFFQFVSSFFSENATVIRTSRKKEAVNNDSKAVNSSFDELHGSSSDRTTSSKFASKSLNPRDSAPAHSYQSLEFDRTARLGYGRKEFNRDLQDDDFNSTGMGYDQDGTVKRSLDDRELIYQNSRRKSLHDRNFNSRMSEYDEIGERTSHRHDDINFGRRHNHDPIGNSKMRSNHCEAYESSHYRVDSKYETRRSYFRSGTTGGKDGLYANDDHSELDNGFVDSSPSSMFSDDALFSKYLMEAGNLLKQAKEWLKVGDNEIHVEQMLYDSAKLLAEAVSLKPMSLLAIGQLGNTYLLHGELKFRMSRELRYFLSGNDNISHERWHSILVSKDEPLPSKGRAVNLLVDVCDECEELLIKAGRKYRMALSIDRNDVRALYNWGLALSFRAQLIADIGPETAGDADKLFLAAIDKFDAMMSRGNIYAPDALFRWGMALQQRSRLRPSNSRDKVKLLQQARRLYEDALNLGSSDFQPQVREALSSCMFELNP